MMAFVQDEEAENIVSRRIMTAQFPRYHIDGNGLTVCDWVQRFE